MASTPESAIQAALLEIVETRLGAGEYGSLTLKRVRAAAEEKLGLPPDYLKNHSMWKDRSKKLVTDEVARLENERDHGDPSASAPEPKSKAPKKEQSAGIASAKKEAKSPQQKRKTPAGAKAKEKPRKRQKKSESDDHDPAPPSEDDASDGTPVPKASKHKSAESQPQPRKKTKVMSSKLDESDLAAESKGATPKKPAKRNFAKATPQMKKRVAESQPEADNGTPFPKPSKKEDPLPSHIGFGHSPPPSPQPTNANNAQSESPLSSPIDEPAPAKKKQKKQKRSAPSESKTIPKSKPKPKPLAKPKKPTAANANLTPAQEEIKRLQSQLLKCGVRKMWARELGKFESDGESVGHLRGLLKGVGMEGRFSEEKARAIKEERELRKELEAIREGERDWGLGGGGGGGGGGDGGDGDEVGEGGVDGGGGGRNTRPRVPLALQELDFGDEED